MCSGDCVNSVRMSGVCTRHTTHNTQHNTTQHTAHNTQQAHTHIHNTTQHSGNKNRPAPNQQRSPPLLPPSPSRSSTAFHCSLRSSSRSCMLMVDFGAPPFFIDEKNEATADDFFPPPPLLLRCVGMLRCCGHESGSYTLLARRHSRRGGEGYWWWLVVVGRWRDKACACLSLSAFCDQRSLLASRVPNASPPQPLIIITTTTTTTTIFLTCWAVSAPVRRCRHSMPSPLSSL